MKYTLNTFIDRCNEIHANYYDYSKVIFKNMSTHIIITCPIHGDFNQLPSFHLHRKCGCLKCYRDSQRITKEDFFQSAREKYGDRFMYGEFNGYREEIDIVCINHGKFITTPELHLKNRGGCPDCRRLFNIIPNNVWIQRFREVYDDLFNYDHIQTQITSSEKIPIECAKHGIFYALPTNHVVGKHGCKLCACEEKYCGGYSEQFFEKNPNYKNNIGKLYLVRATNKETNKSFVKIGITTRSIDDRFMSWRKQFTSDVIEYVEMTLYEAHLQEMYIRTNYQNKRYFPKERPDGWTDCFYDSLLHEDYIKQVFNLL